MKRQDMLKLSIVLRKADCASGVNESASSKKIILKGALTGAVLAKFLILLRTTSMPRSSEALSSVKLLLQSSLYSSCAKAIAALVFPVPAAPANIKCGMFSNLT
jgi:hypothetical protein